VRVGDVISPEPPRTVPQSASLREVIQAFTGTSQYCFPVVDNGGAMTGVVYVYQIREFLEQDEHGPLLIAHDVATEVTPIRSDEHVNVALQRLVTLDVEELPVVAPENPYRPIALVSRRGLMATYNRLRLERMAKAKDLGSIGM